MRGPKSLIALAVAGCLLAGCGSDAATTGTTSPATTSTSAAQTQGGEEAQRPNLKTFDITLNGDFDADHAGVMMADKLGYFEAAGFAITVHKPILPLRPLVYVNDGAVDLGVTTEPEILLARQRGVPVVGIGTLLSRPTTTALIWLPQSGMQDARDLAGKTIATAGLRYEESFVEAILRQAGLPSGAATIHKVGYKQAETLAKGHADAILADPTLAVPELEARGLSPTVVPVTKLGIPPYDQLVVFARENRLRSEPESMRSFMRALARGTEAAKKDPEAAADAVQELTELPPEIATAGLAQTLPLLSASNRIDPGPWRRFAAWMKAERLLSAKVRPDQALSDAYLP